MPSKLGVQFLEGKVLKCLLNTCSLFYNCFCKININVVQYASVKENVPVHTQTTKKIKT